MRTLETIRMYNFAQKNHWQLICDLSDNDYDIHYFDGRQSANIALDEFLQELEILILIRFQSFLLITLKNIHKSKKNFIKKIIVLMNITQDM